MSDDKYDIIESELEIIIYILTVNNSEYKTLTKDTLKSIFDFSVNKETIKNIKNIVFLENIIKNSTFTNINHDNIKIDNSINIKKKDKEFNSKSINDKYQHLRNNIYNNKHKNDIVVKNISKQLENITKYKNKENNIHNNIHNKSNEQYCANKSYEEKINHEKLHDTKSDENMLNKYPISPYNRYEPPTYDNLQNYETPIPPSHNGTASIYDRLPHSMMYSSSKYDIHKLDYRRQPPNDYGRQPPHDYGRQLPHDYRRQPPNDYGRQPPQQYNNSVSASPHIVYEVRPYTSLTLYDRLKMYKSNLPVYDKPLDNEKPVLNNKYTNKNEKDIGKDSLYDKNYSNQEYDYFKNLPDNKKLCFHNIEEEIKEYNKTDIPMRFKILEKELTLPNKAIVIKKLEDISKSQFLSSNDNKYNGWINGLLKIPFGNYLKLPITKENNKEEINDYLNKTRTLLDKAVYGHEDTKIQIVQLLAQWISNPESGGNVIGIQGPMGTGKTTLVKNGISKAIERPFHFITLGGCSDSSFLEGHSYTYEGSVWGKVIDVLMKAECMNPVFYFDELDKVSKTPKGDEIINALIHLTDNTQNTNFQDKYFTGLDIDLSKSVFIFSYNNINDINPILLDRLINIKIDGFKIEEKLPISRSYLIPEICTKLGLDKDTIIIEDEDIKYIIENYTDESGVRALKKCLDSIYSKINVFLLTSNKEILPFDIGEIELPYKINKKNIDILLKVNTDKENNSLQYMYM